MIVQIGNCIHAGVVVSSRFLGRDCRLQIAVGSGEKFTKVVEAIARRPAFTFIKARVIIRSELEISVTAETVFDQIHLLRGAGKCRVFFCRWTSETTTVLPQVACRCRSNSPPPLNTTRTGCCPWTSWTTRPTKRTSDSFMVDKVGVVFQFVAAHRTSK